MEISKLVLARATQEHCELRGGEVRLLFGRACRQEIHAADPTDLQTRSGRTGTRTLPCRSKQVTTSRATSFAKSAVSFLESSRPRRVIVSFSRCPVCTPNFIPEALNQEGGSQ